MFETLPSEFETVLSEERVILSYSFYIYIYIVVMFQVYACLSYRGLKISTDGDRSSGRWDPGLVARLLMRIITEGSTAVMCLGTVGLTGGTSFFWGGPRVFVDP